MTLSHIVNPAQRWRIVSGFVPSCPVGTIVALSTTGDRLEVGRPGFGVVAQLNLSNARISASPDGHELTSVPRPVRLSSRTTMPSPGPRTPARCRFSCRSSRTLRWP